jgi:AmmeMemoRadiSam system protein B
MKYKNFSFLCAVFCLIFFTACKQRENAERNIRLLADTVGFARYDWQMDSIMNRIQRYQGDLLLNTLVNINQDHPWKTAICPHDDYSYVGYLYPAVMKNVKAKTIFLFGVAHQARILKLENQVIFDSHDYWKGPYGLVRVSSIREEIISQLPPEMFRVNDSMQRMEHSLEALIPFLQFFNRDIEIIPILVPYMSFDKLEWAGRSLSNAIYSIAQERDWKWGKDYAILISNDAVHYGDENWGGKNFSWYGTDSLGYQQAIKHEQEIMQSISGDLYPDNVRSFCNYTVQDTNFRDYKWTWCGRYSIPLGLLTTYYLNKIYGGKTLQGIQIGYATSIDHPHIPVTDLGMGVTAPANMKHWVGYAGIGYH